MAIDGVFLKYLINEIKPQITNKRINKIISINDQNFVFVLPQKLKLLCSLTTQGGHFRLTTEDYLNSNTLLSTFLKKHIEGGIITDVTQYHNDRIVTFKITNTDDLGYHKHYHLILELTGRNSNLIITDENLIILEALKKSYLSDDRIIQVKAEYQYLESEKSNPYHTNELANDNIYEGVSKLLFHELIHSQSLDVLKRPPNPCLITNENKIFFYVFDLVHLSGERNFFPTISLLLEHYFIHSTSEINQNQEQKRISQLINREINKLTNKLEKQEIELQLAHKKLDLEKTANVLAANIHLVKPYQTEITVLDFYTNKEITIPLNTKISPNENINYYFNKFKKAKRTITHLKQTIETTKTEIKYYQTLNNQLDLSNINDLREILNEVGIKKEPKRQAKPHILKYIDEFDNIIWVGKNNIQNNYLTHSLAHKNDYFFHVVNYPGSHVIFRGELNQQAIILAAHIAAYYSKAQGSVAVDYTQVKWIKKVKGQKGSFVTYTHQKSINVDPDYDYIEKHTSLDK